MQTKSHGSPKENESRQSLLDTVGKAGISHSAHTPYSRLTSQFMTDTTTPKVVDRIVETYRGILRTLTPDVTFEATIEVMVRLGCFSSLKTKTELRQLFDLRKSELIS
jgi:hypothetical protein